MTKTLIKLAKQSDHTNYKHAAIILKGGAVISHGYNRGKNHAEINALNKIWGNKRGKTHLIVIRLNKQHNGFLMSKPCNNCMREMKQCKISKISYTNENGIFITERL